MRFAFFIFVLLALSAFSRPVDVLDLCSMTTEQLSNTEIDAMTIIHIPKGGDMDCSQYLKLDPTQAKEIQKCLYVKEGSVFSEWHYDIRWLHLLVKCRRLKSACAYPCLHHKPVEQVVPRTWIAVGAVNSPCYCPLSPDSNASLFD